MGASHTAIALQEVCLSKRQTIAMRKKANSFGYDAFFSVPQPTKYSNGADHVHGGVCLLIQRSCRHWLSSTCMCDQGQAVCVDMDAFCLIAFYARPVEDKTTLHKPVIPCGLTNSRSFLAIGMKNQVTPQ